MILSPLRSRRILRTRRWQSAWTASFTARATGWPPPTVQWQTSTNSGATWNSVSGATSTTWTFTTAPADAGKWVRAVFTNSLGQAVSNAASLTVTMDPPVVTVHPVAQTVKAGKFFTFRAAATGLPTPTVRWQVSTDSGATWTNVPDAASTTYARRAKVSNQGNWFRAVFTNPVGQAATNAAILTVRSVSGSDFNGDGTTDLAVYRRTTGVWYVRNLMAVQFGGPGYIPVAGDYNGDGTTDVAVYQPTTGFWYVRNQFATQFGEPGDIPGAGRLRRQ